jgi:Mrp family chromosome partitioning ATPase
MLGFKGRSEAKAASSRKRFEDDIEILRLRITGSAPAGGGVTCLLGQEPGIGTTTLAVWLAHSLARESRPTLLVDGNFENPSVHDLFGTASERGTEDLLERRAEARDVVRATSVANLSVLPCAGGKAPSTGASVEQWRGRLRNLASDRFVLIDAGSADSPSALTLADASDGVILVVRSGHARHEQIEAIQKRMSLNGTRLLGIILNQRQYRVPEMIYRRL